MKKFILLLVFSFLFVPNLGFAESWVQVESGLGQPVYYDYDSVVIPADANHLITVRIKSELSPSEQNEYSVNGEAPDEMAIFMTINTVERYFEPLKVELLQNGNVIGSVPASKIFPDVEISEVDGSELVFFEDNNDPWGIADLIVDIYEKFQA